ncbi:MAG: cysteine methyltransferase [Bergeyella sp.]
MLHTHLSTSNNNLNGSRKTLLLEIELNGKIPLENILNTIYEKFGFVYKIITAEIEFYNGQNFGIVQLEIETEYDKHHELEHYLNRSKLLNTFIEYRTKKAV